MRIAFILWASTIPNLQVYMFRRLRDDLRKNHMEGPRGFRVLLQPWIDSGLVEIVADEIRFKFNGSKIYLCHCRHEEEVTKYQGAEIHVLGIEEAGQFTEYQYRFLRNRVRKANLNLPPELKGTFPRVLLTANPGGIGHQWLKRMFVTYQPAYEIKRTERSEARMLRQFIPATLDDNPTLTQEDPEYEYRLEGLGNEDLVQAMRYGNWDLVAGAFFPELSRDKHLIQPFAVPRDWFKFRSFDYGSAKPAAANWWTISNGDLVQNVLGESLWYPPGALIGYREWYVHDPKKTNVGLRLSNKELAQGIMDRTAPTEDIKYTVTDALPFRAEGQASIALQMWNEARLSLVQGDVKPGSRINSAQYLRSLIKGYENIPMFYLFNYCTMTWETLVSVQPDQKHPDDVDTKMEDHAYDSTRMAAQSLRMDKKMLKSIAPDHLKGETRVSMDQLWEIQKQINERRNKR